MGFFCLFVFYWICFFLFVSNSLCGSQSLWLKKCYLFYFQSIAYQWKSNYLQLIAVLFNCSSREIRQLYCKPLSKLKMCPRICMLPCICPLCGSARESLTWPRFDQGLSHQVCVSKTSILERDTQPAMHAVWISNVDPKKRDRYCSGFCTSKAQL